MNFYTTEEASQVLLVGKETIRRYIKSGLLKAHKINRHYLISKESVEELIKNNLATSFNVGITDIKQAIEPTKPNKADMTIEQRKERLAETLLSNTFKGNIDEIFKEVGIKIPQ